MSEQNKFRSVDELEAERKQLIAECDALQAKLDGGEGTPEEQQALEDKLKRVAEIDAELAKTRTRQEIQHAKERSEAPSRPAPNFDFSFVRSNRPSSGQVFYDIFSHHFGQSSAEAKYRCKQAGINLDSLQNSIPFNFNKLNKKYRTIMSKGGSASGAELVFETWSDDVVRYMVALSPLLNYVKVDNTADGNKRHYSILDGTSVESSYWSASSGSETAPTIPDKNMSTAELVLSTFPITSGYHKITRPMLRDGIVKLEGEITETIGTAHAMKAEREFFTATGDGETGVQGIVSACSAISGSPVTEWSASVMKSLRRSVPVQYRPKAIFASNSTTQGEVENALSDDMGRSLFDKTAADGLEFDVLYGNKWITSEFIPADTVLFFVPEYYVARFVNKNDIDVLKEKFHPNLAYESSIEIGGGYRGPASTAKKVVKS